MTENLATLYYLTGNSAYRDRAEKIVDVFTRENPNQYINMTTILSGFERLKKSVQIVIIGYLNDPKTKEMKNMVLSAGHMDLTLNLMPPDRNLPPNHPAAGKEQINGFVTAYICVGSVCGMPHTSIEGLKLALAET